MKKMQNILLLFHCDSCLDPPYVSGPVIKHKFLSAGIYNVTVNAWNKVGADLTYVIVAVLYRMQRMK